MTRFASDLPETLTTPRLVLVTPQLHHVPSMARLANNRAVVGNLSRLPFPYEEADAQFFVTGIAREPGEWAWCIELNGEHVGNCGLHFAEGQLPEMGFWLGQPFWGRGFATEAAGAMVDAVRASGRFAGVRARALKTNEASLRVQAKLGFRIIGEAPEPEHSNIAGQLMVLTQLDFVA